MKLELTKEQLEFQAEFREFTDKEIIPYADEYDKSEKLPEEIVHKMAKAGYLGSMIPKEFGGMGLDMITLGILNEEIGRGCSSVRGLLTVHGMVALGILRWGTVNQKERLLPKMAKGEVIGAFGLTEPNVGSDANSIESTAEVSGENYILNGKKRWITMGQIADLFLVFAKCNGKSSAFLVERGSEGFSTSPIHGMLGARASMLAELNFKDCIIPKENLIARIGAGFTHVALSCLNYGRYTVAFGCVGLGQACLEQSMSYASKRKQFGVYLKDNQLIQKMITDMVVSVKTARLICYQAGYLTDIADPDCIMETWVAKYTASKMVNKVASDAVQIFGANGLNEEYPIERYLRDARVNEIIEGTTQMHEIMIAKNALRSFRLR